MSWVFSPLQSLSCSGRLFYMERAQNGSHVRWLLYDENMHGIGLFVSVSAIEDYVLEH